MQPTRILPLLAALIAAGCSTTKETAPAAAVPASLADSITFHAPFDGSLDASFAKGDRALYTAASYEDRSDAKPGLHNPSVTLEETGGRFGGALRFGAKNTMAIFYQAAQNVPFDGMNWSGTVSFWLNLNPDKDLEPGFSDPIQITDKAYNDSAIWVDFTKDDTPRHFRLGVFGSLTAWNPNKLPPDQNPDFNNRLVAVTQPPFESGRWTHVVATWQGLGSGSGTARLYLDGQLQGSTPTIAERFEWDLSRAAIRLGVSYVGLFDELAVFSRALDDQEVATLHGLPQGAAELHP